MDISKSIRNKKVFKLALLSVAMQILFYLIFAGSVANSIVSQSWQAGNSSFMFGLFLILSLLAVGVFSRKAFDIHIIFSAISITWIIPFLVAGYELSGKAKILTFFTVVVCLLNLFRAYRETFHILNAQGKPAVRSGRLDLAQKYWDLDKPLYVENDKLRKEYFARLLLPLGSILGVLLYRNFPAHNSILSILLDYFLATVLIMITGIHLAAAMYIKSIEKNLKIDIQV